MSIHKSYFNKNNTLLSQSTINTAKNPVTEIYYGGGYYEKECVFTGYPNDTCIDKWGATLTGYSRQRVYKNYSRFIFQPTLTDLRTKVTNNTIQLGGDCCGNGPATHTVKMVNTSFFDDRLLNTQSAKLNRRATSFDLILFTIPDSWDEGVGYDYDNSSLTSTLFDDKSYSDRPSNWYNRTTVNSWGVPGIYDYIGTTPTIIATQHFDNGNENIELDITTHMNSILTGATANNGYGIAFVRQLENLSGLTESYSVGFFTKYTQTFYEPYVETKYDDYINDARADFYEGKTNYLYLYVNAGGTPTNLDNLPTVQVFDNAGTEVMASTTACQVTKGVYCISVTIPCDTYTTPCMFTDRWSNINIAGVCKNDVTNKFVLKSNTDYFDIGTNVNLPKHYGYSVSGIKMDEKVVSGNVRKVLVSARKEYTTNEPAAIDDLYYRLYVTQGTTQVETVPWTKINVGYNQNYFIVDTGDMIPNEYYMDIKAISNLDVNTYPEIIKFQVVNQANYFGNPPSDNRQ